MPTPAGLASIFPQDFLNTAYRVATLEARDPKYGAKPGTFASILNRFHMPGYGSNWQSWMNPNQYAVLKKPTKETGGLARQFYNSPEGLRLLANTANQLGGVGDFRSTSYLNKQGLLMKYPDNLIPVRSGGGLQYLTPAEIRKKGLTPDFTENTLFSETGKKAQKPWWQKLGPRSEVLDAQEPVATTSPASSGENIAIAGQNNPELMALLMNQINSPLLPQRRETPTSSFSNFLKAFGSIG
jgi:hypothetical protein